MQPRLNEHEASALLGLSVNTLRTDRYHTQHAGEQIPTGVVPEPKLNIPFIKLGRRVLYDPDKLREWQASRERRYG